MSSKYKSRKKEEEIVNELFSCLSLAPTVGPENVTFFKVNGTTYKISWASLKRDYGTVISYEVTRVKVSSGLRSRRSNSDSSSINSTETFAVIYDFDLCSTYTVSVRGYTGAGPGVYSPNIVLKTSSEYTHSILRTILSLILNTNK